ncbi:hypothetical protein D3C72_2132030 [compost metagenome]
MIKVRLLVKEDMFSAMIFAVRCPLPALKRNVLPLKGVYLRFKRGVVNQPYSEL